MFKNRSEAGEKLAERLSQYKNSDAIVLALPRGGVVVGSEVAHSLNVPLDIVVVRKIGHPQNPEYAICATDEKGTFLCNEAEARLVDPVWLKEEIERQRKEAKRRIKLYRGGKTPFQISNRIAIIVDDGIATGLSMRLVIAAVKAEHPQRVIVAIPVAPSNTAQEIGLEVDELIVLESPESFLGAVGAHYEEFEQVADEEVIRLMEKSY